MDSGGKMKAKMKLKQFRVRSFRSVDDSGWIEVDEVGALIGINESGKSNLLTPLWKLNPAKDGIIHPLSDYPRSLYNKVRTLKKKPEFIEASFELSEEFVKKVSSLTNFPEAEVQIVTVARDFEGLHRVSFPNASPERSLSNVEVREIFGAARNQIESLASVGATDEQLKSTIITLIEACVSNFVDDGGVDGETLGELRTDLEGIDTTSAGQHSTIAPRFGQLIDTVKDMQDRISRPYPHANEEVKKLVLTHLPKFIYYSNYGNLDSEIYLPHVIDNMERKDLGPKESAKARTLKVLFDFVKLQPKEIMQLGHEPQNSDS